jgi:chaperonin GroES
MSTLKPLADYVVAEAEEAPTKTAAGLYLPGGAAEKPKVAIVTAVGPGRVGDDNEAIPVAVKKGDRILYSYTTTDVKLDGKPYLLIKEDAILAVIEG